jgi:hypothetical protein
MCGPTPVVAPGSGERVDDERHGGEDQQHVVVEDLAERAAQARQHEQRQPRRGQCEAVRA